MRAIIILQLFFFWFSNVNSQDCEAFVKIILKNINGGFYRDQTVKLTSKLGGTVFEMVSDAKGEATFKLPCNTVYDLTVSNYSKSKELRVPEKAGMVTERKLTYAPDMIAREKAFAMSAAEVELLDISVTVMPDTFFVKNAIMETPANKEYFSATHITLLNIEGKPLAGELLYLTGIKRGKSIKGTTDLQGKIFIWLPKGDSYTLNFKHHKNYAKIACDYSKGTSNISITFSYLGAKEIERRKKIEAERIAAEEKRLKEEEKKFTTYCKKLGITSEEGRKREIGRYIESVRSFNDTVVLSALKRNKWNDKLIVCDLTGSMSPYSAQLSLWYQLHYEYEKNLQFVFFNDGNNMPDSEKKIGQTGGIYYSKSEGKKELANLMAKVSSNGGGGDCPENNMEALIKGTKMAAPFKELVMIVDNHAPVKDIELLNKFNVPVHIILCGVYDRVLLDYLLIAWKTKGSIHTIEQDIVNIASMMEGQEIEINGITYRIMGGEFVCLTKM